MSFISSLSIKIKILSLAAIAIVGFVVSLMINVNMNTDNSERLQLIQTVFFPVVEASKANNVYLSRMEEVFSTAVSTGEMDFVLSADRIRLEVLADLQNISQLWPEKRTATEQIKADFEAYYNLARSLSVHMIEGTLAAGDIGAMVEGMNAALANTRNSMDVFSKNSLDAFNETVTASNQAATMVQTLSIAVALVILIIMVIYAWTISRSINSSLNDLLSSLKDIASGDGDLTSRIKKSSQDEIGEVVDWFNQFIDKLHCSIGEIITNTQPLTRVSEDLYALVGATTKMTQQQNQATESVALVVDGMLGSMHDVSNHARSAAEAAREADSVAKDGRLIVAETVASINNLAGEIEKAGEVIRKLQSDADNVGAILDVIRGIAEQTNLLALNAAIEAARAGEQGRGFAVVADEVRTLASRTQESTIQIQQVIEQLQTAAHSAVWAMDDSKDKADTSVKQAARTGESLVQITAKVESILTMNNQIEVVTDRQEQSAQSIKDNVMGIKTSSADAMASMQQVEASSSALTDIAKTLRSVTGQFRV